MPRLVRKAPLSERVWAYLDFQDWYLWISEELSSNDWEEFAKSYALWIGIASNILFIISRANTGVSSSEENAVFGDSGSSGIGWGVWMANSFVYLLASVFILNAYFTFSQKRHYRFFEQNIDANPSTPSAHRVRVDASPAASPLRFLQNIIRSETAESRAHPDSTRDVWELAVWDPNPLCLQLFCFLSPGHILVYWMFLPVAPLDAHPSVTVFTTMFLAALLSAQLLFLRNNFSQQTKDSALIHKEVLNEYDKKYVHPSLQRPVRDVATQTPPKRRESRELLAKGGLTEVDTYTPTTIVNRGFHTNPNPTYSSQYDPHNLAQQPSLPRLRSSNSIQTPSLRPSMSSYTNGISTSTSTATQDFSSPVRAPTQQTPIFPQPKPRPQPQYRHSGVGSGDGGSLGVYTHAASPLRKAASTNYLRDDGGRNDSRRREGSPTKREGSPLKRMSTPSGFCGANVGVRGYGGTERRDDREGRITDRRGYSNLGVGRRESGGW